MGDQGSYEIPNARISENTGPLPHCQDYVQEFQQPESQRSCDDYLILINSDITQREQELRNLRSQQRWFEERRRQPSETEVTAGSSGDYGSLRSQDTYASSDIAVPNHSLLPSRSDISQYDQASTRVIQDSYSVEADNPYNPREPGLRAGGDPYRAAGESSREPRGLQCVVIKDYEAQEPQEIDLHENDWVELQQVQGNKYYGSVFGRGGKNKGWFHKNFVDVIPDSHVGSLVFKYVTEGTVKYPSHRRDLFSVDAGKKFDVLEENVTLDNDQMHLYHRVRDITGKMGLVITFCLRRCEVQNPVLHQRDWYYPRIARKDAEELLGNKRTCTFLFRDSGNAPGNFTISVRGETGRVYHVIVITHRAGYRVRSKTFKSLDDILAHYRINAITRNLTLQHHLPKDEPHSYQNMTNDVTSPS